MKNICTLSDYNYLNRGLSLIDSLNNNNNDIFVYYLCMDEKAYKEGLKKNIKNTLFVNLNDILNYVNHDLDVKPSDEALSMEKQIGISAKSMQLNYMMSSIFPKYCLEKFNLNNIIYCDPDIYFYDSLDLIYEEVGTSSIGLVEHRVPHTNCGRFNVGIIYFLNDEYSKKCLSLWSNCMLNPENEYSQVYGTCGDQKYLELIYEKYPDKICIIDKLVGHLAPWNLIYHHYKEKNKIIWKNIEQKLNYIHYSNFSPNENFTEYLFAPRHNIFKINNNHWLHDLASEYMVNLKENI